jgi:glycine/D-amino acid oxidase-like deaminating enzyme
MKRLLDYDVLIIGGGVIGLSIAIALQESEARLRGIIHAAPVGIGVASNRV